jgi:hypothetical protein
MFAHAPAGDAVLHFWHEQPNIGGTEPAMNAEAVRRAARLKHAAEPNRKILSQTDLDAAHALDTADHRQRRALSPEHSGCFEYANHAGAALHDGRECRHMRIEPRLEPHLASQIGVGEIDDDRTPYGEVDRTAALLRHRLDDGHRQAKRVAIGERPIHRDKRRPHARD